ncbi:MAG: hypothetical protein QM630_02715 [Microbacterium sp.]
MNGVQRDRIVVLLIGAVALVVVAVLLAPIVTVTSYGDAPDGSVTFAEQRSVVGFETSLWLWAAVTICAVLATALAALVFARVRRQNPGKGPVKQTV